MVMFIGWIDDFGSVMPISWDVRFVCVYLLFTD